MGVHVKGSSIRYYVTHINGWTSYLCLDENKHTFQQENTSIRLHTKIANNQNFSFYESSHTHDPNKEQTKMVRTVAPFHSTALAIWLLDSFFSSSENREYHVTTSCNAVCNIYPCTLQLLHWAFVNKSLGTLAHFLRDIPDSTTATAFFMWWMSVHQRLDSTRTPVAHRFFAWK